MLCTLELVASGHLQLVEIVWAKIRQGMSLEPRPKIFDWIEVRRIWRQECDLNVSIGTVEVFANQLRFVCPEAIEDYQQRLFQMSLERFEKLDDLLLLDALFVEAEQVVRSGQTRNHRQMFPIEVKLNNRRFPFGRPSAHAGGPFADSGFVDEYNQSFLSHGFFLSEGQVLFLNSCTASSLCSIALRSGFWLLNPSAPRMRQICTSLNDTSNFLSMSRRTRLSVHSSVPNPCWVDYRAGSAATHPTGQHPVAQAVLSRPWHVARQCLFHREALSMYIPFVWPRLWCAPPRHIPYPEAAIVLHLDRKSVV